MQYISYEMPPAEIKRALLIAIILSPFSIILGLLVTCTNCDSVISRIADCKDNGRRNLARCISLMKSLEEEQLQGSWSLVAFCYAARAAYELKDWHKAFEYSQRVFSLRQYDRILGLIYIDAAIMLDRDLDAIQIASLLLTRNKEDVVLLLKRAWSYIKVGNFQLAEMDIQLAEAVGISRREEIRAAAAIYERLGNLEAAKTFAERALKANPNDTDAKLLLSALEERLRLYQELQSRE